MTRVGSGSDSRNSHQPAATGTENLEVMSDARRYLAHIGSLVANELPAQGKILEFGSGNGVQTTHVNVAKTRITCVEIDATQRTRLTESGFSAVNDLNELANESFAGAFSINCLEHVPDDVSVLKEIHRVLPPGAPLVLFVPAFPMLYTSMDARVGHVRRYRRCELVEKLESAGYVVERCRYVDSLGFVLSLLYRILRLRAGAPSALSVKLFDNVIFPMSSYLDRPLHRVLGKNLFVVGRRS